MSKNLEQTCRKLLEVADIQVNGNRPWDMRVNNPGVFKRVLTGGPLALGESYMDGWWDCDQLDEFFFRIITSGIEERAKEYLDHLTKLRIGFEKLKNRFSNQQSRSKSRRVAEQHYDVGNELFEKMLGETMAYSCGYWREAQTLDEAQEAKFDLICRKLGLEPKMSVLDIGCGFGTLLEYAARKFGIRGIGITLSEEQAKAAQEKCRGMDIEIRVQDYRDVKGKFDRVVSVGMFEHVGPKNYRRFFQTTNNCLTPEGLLLLHTIGTLNPKGVTYQWLDKYIFPGGFLPSETQIINASNGLFINEDLHNLRGDYVRTLRAWHNNFTRNWQDIKEQGNGRYDDRFKRMWDYYLFGCEAAFESGINQLWQIVFSKPERPRAYESVR